MDTTRLSADRIGGLIWFVFGAAIVYGSWTMDRLEHLHIPPATAPGVVPGLLGIGIICFALVLILRKGKAAVVDFSGIDATTAAAEEDGGFHWKRLALSAVLCLSYGVLLGRGIPYSVLTAIFLFLHLMLLGEGEQVPERPTVPRFILAAVLSLAVTTVVSLVFQYLFLVRLP